MIIGVIITVLFPFYSTILFVENNIGRIIFEKKLCNKNEKKNCNYHTDDPLKTPRAHTKTHFQRKIFKIKFHFEIKFE